MRGYYSRGDNHNSDVVVVVVVCDVANHALQLPQSPCCNNDNNPRNTAPSLVDHPNHHPHHHQRHHHHHRSTSTTCRRSSKRRRRIQWLCRQDNNNRCRMMSLFCSKHWPRVLRVTELLVLLVGVVVSATTAATVPPSSPSSVPVRRNRRRQQQRNDALNDAPLFGSATTNRRSTSSSPTLHHHHHHHPTIVSGYGSARYKEAGTVRIVKTTTTTTSWEEQPSRHRRRNGEDHDSVVRTTTTSTDDNNNDHARQQQQRRTTVRIADESIAAPLYIYLHDDNGSESAASSTGSHDTTDTASTTRLSVYSVPRNVTIQLVNSNHNSDNSPRQQQQQQVQAHVVPDHQQLNPIQQPRIVVGPQQQERQNDNIAPGWIPVEGLYGVYAIPSGLVYVWIVDSEPVYTATTTNNNHIDDVETSHQQQQQQDVWWQIRRVRELYLTRVVHHSCSSSSHGTSRLQQRREEQRQLALLRQALKDHDWYFCPTTTTPSNIDSSSTCPTDPNIHSNCRHRTTTTIIPDMTRNLQTNFLAHKESLSQGTSTTDFLDQSKDMDSWTERREVNQRSLLRWWESRNYNNNNNADNVHLQQQQQDPRPDARFFWNENLVQPIVEKAQQQQQMHDVDVTNSTTTPSAYHVLMEHVIPVTSAFCGVQRNLTTRLDDDNTSGDNTNNNLRYDQILISRRSKFRAGTRFTKRGADATGAVANYAETEQIVLVWQPEDSASSSCVDNNNSVGKQQQQSSPDTWHLAAVMSHVQIRGSIPLRWSSPTDIKTYRPRVRIGTDPLAQARAVRDHLIDQGSRYIVTTKPDQTDAPRTNIAQRWTRDKSPASLLLVNLIDKKSDQRRLGRALEAVVKAILDVYSTTIVDTAHPWLNNLHVRLLWYDFHANVKSGRWDRLATLLEQVKPSLDQNGYFYAVPTIGGTLGVSFSIKGIQSGVVRTNCMDNLDRTNVVQSIFGRYMLHQQLDGFQSAASQHQTKVSQTPSSLPWLNGEVAHRLLWADNADLISRLYAGTPALKGDYTRTGKRTKRGALDDGVNSLQRYYLNNFLDTYRQEGIDLLTGEEPFSNLGEDSDGHALKCQDSMGNAGRQNGMSIQEAARKILFGSFGNDRESDLSDEDFVRIKVKPNRRQRSLDLRWLPGDLQTQMRHLLSSTSSSSSSDDDGSFKSQEYLQSMDLRTATDVPWWVASDSTSESDPEGTSRGSGDDDEDTRTTERVATGLDAVEVSVTNNPGILLGALVMGTQAPVAMAAIVIGLVAASSSSYSSFPFWG